MVQINAVLQSPIVTEKTVAMKGKYTFRVHADATKENIKKAIDSFYGVEAIKVNILHTSEKTRTLRRGQEARKKASFKKAIVTLKKGETIDFNTFK